MHCHLKDSILDVGLLYSVWCFSFERYNDKLEGMQKTWQTPEVQLFKKLLNLQFILNMHTPPEAPSIVRDTFTNLKDIKLTQAQETVDPVIIVTHEKHLFSFPLDVSALKKALYLPLHPIRENYFKGVERSWLMDMYVAIYGIHRVTHVPHEFSQIKVLGELYTSFKCRSE